MLNTTIQTSGDDAIAFSLTRFAAGKPRQDRYAESLTNIVLDIDTPMTLEEVAALQKWWIRRPFFTPPAALQRWTGTENDILDWQALDDGEAAWAVGQQVENGVTELSGVVLANDGERICLGVAIKNGNEQGDAHSRIFSIPSNQMASGGAMREAGQVVKVLVRDGQAELTILRLVTHNFSDLGRTR